VIAIHAREEKGWEALKGDPLMLLLLRLLLLLVVVVVWKG
jgi:hypothetical protein